MRLLRRIMVLVLLIFTLGQTLGILSINPTAAAVTQFSFASAGDYGFSSAAKTVMSSMGSSGASFALGVGDFLYTKPTSTVSEKTWCNQFKASVPNLELIVGNHETWETNSTDGGGSINKFLLYCPFTFSGKTGTYGFRYYFDYPSSAPLARFIMVDPAIWNRTTSSSSLSYASGTANYNWVASAVDNARSNGIPWIIVVMHKVCIRTGTQSCEVPMSFLTMLMNKRVDLIIQGHDHTYQRSKQLTCATEGTYVSSCVANAGSSLAKGAGTVYVIDGTGGEGGSRTLKTPDTGYFAAYCCSTGTPLGYSLFTITSTTFQSKFVNTGGQSYNDGFTISGNTPPTPTFTLSPSPSSVSFAAGGSATSTLTVSSVNGFTGTVSLVSSVSPSTGLTASLSPSSVSLTSGSKATSLLTLSNGSTGSYTVSLTGSSGSLTKTGSVSVTVTDFSVSATPSSLNFPAKNSASSTITVTSRNGFSGTVGLSASSSPAGPTLSFSASSVTLPANGSTFSTLTVSSSVAGTFTVTVVGSSNGLSHSTTITVTVSQSQTQDFTISANPSTVAFNSGASGSTTLTLASASGFSGTLSITSSVSPSSGLSVSCNPSSITLTSSTTSGSSNCTFTSSVAGPYTASISASNGTLTRSTTVTVHVGDFVISVTPSSIVAQAGSNNSATVTLSSSEQFTGTVTLSVTASSSNVTSSVTPSSVQVPSGGSITATLTLSSNSPGNYIITITGKSGALTHSVNMAFQVTTKPSTPAYALVTSFEGQLYKYQNGGTLTLLASPVTTALRLISWKPDGSYALIVGDSATLLKWDGTTLTQISTSVMPSGDDLNTVAWKPDGSYAIMGGTDGVLLIYDGTTLTRVTDPNTNQIQGISWNPAGTAALIVGNAGALFTYQNGVVTLLSSGTTNDLYGVAWNPNGAYALISGANGSILRWEGTTVTVLNTSGLYPSTTIVRYVAWNSAGTQALLVGNAGGLVLSYDGTNLSVLTSGTSNGLFSITWSGATATIVGNNGTILAYSAGTLNTSTTSVTSNLRGIAWKPA